MPEEVLSQRQVVHRDFDRLSLITLEARWLAILVTFLTLLFEHALSPAFLGLVTVASVYNLAQSIFFLKHWHLLSSRWFIIIGDAVLLFVLIFLEDKYPYLDALLLLPAISAASWFGLLAGTLVALGLDTVLVGHFFLEHEQNWPYLFFMASFIPTVAFYIGRTDQSEVAKRDEVQALAAELARDKARLTALIDGIGDGLLATDRKGEIIFYNLAATYLLGRPEEDLHGEHLEKLLPVRHGIDPYDLLGLTFRTGSREQRDDLEVDMGENHLRLYTSVAPILDEKGDITGAIVLFRDVTKEKAQEEERTAFASVAAHELRTPVTVIEGYLSYLLQTGKLHYDPQTRTYIERAHESVVHLTQLIGDILQVTRAEQGKIDIALEPTDLQAVVSETIAALKPRADQKGVALKVEAPARLPRITTDPGKVKEVLTNYLDNAIKFSDHGEIVVRVKPTDEEIRVEVQDQGMGLSAADQARIWQKFYRAENWRTRKTNGTGLGLFICKTLIEALDGRVGVNSKMGEGSTFFFTLPLRAVSPKLVEKQTRSEAAELISSL